LDVQRRGGWKDIQGMKIVNWKMCAQDRDKWKAIVEQAKTHTEL
jgi:hypothetical protein